MAETHDDFAIQVLKAPPNLFGPLVVDPDMGRVFQWLQDHHLKRMGRGIMIDGGQADAPPTVGVLVDRVIKDLKLATKPSLVRGWVRDALASAPDVMAGTPQAANTASAPGFDLSFAVVPGTIHKDLKDGKTSTDAEQGQITLQADIDMDSDDPAFPKLSWQVQLAGSGHDFAIQGISGSLNATWSKDFLDGALKLEAVVSLLAGVAPDAPPPSPVSVSMVPQGQVGVSGQVTYVLPGTGKHVQLVFKMSTSVTATQGSNPTADFGPQALLQVTF